MRKRVGVVTDDRILFNKIRLLLRDTADVTQQDADMEPEGFDLIFSDVRFASPDHQTVKIGADIPLPFTHDELLSAFNSAKSSHGDALTLSKDGKRAYLFGEEIKLTEVEYKLLGRLVSMCPEYVSREELLESVWGGECDTGVVNVYVHYLRQKLEKNGNKVIISSRKYGYKIDEKYRRDR